MASHYGRAAVSGDYPYTGNDERSPQGLAMPDAYPHPSHRIVMNSKPVVLSNYSFVADGSTDTELVEHFGPSITNVERVQLIGCMVQPLNLPTINDSNNCISIQYATTECKSTCIDIPLENQTFATIQDFADYIAGVLTDNTPPDITVIAMVDANDVVTFQFTNASATVPFTITVFFQTCNASNVMAALGFGNCGCQHIDVPANNGTGDLVGMRPATLDTNPDYLLVALSTNGNNMARICANEVSCAHHKYAVVPMRDMCGGLHSPSMHEYLIRPAETIARIGVSFFYPNCKPVGICDIKFVVELHLSSIRGGVEVGNMHTQG